MRWEMDLQNGRGERCGQQASDLQTGGERREASDLQGGGDGPARG